MNAKTLLVSLLIAIVGVLAAGYSRAAPAARIQVETEPAADVIVPDETVVQTRVAAVDADGRPIPNSVVTVKVETPASSWLTTDFPHVEGTTLLSLDTEASEGVVEFGTIYPIRGTYTIEAQATLPDGTVVTAQPALTIGENPVERRNILLLVAGLFGFGGIAGWVIGRSRRAAATLAVIIVFAFPTAVDAHGPGDHEAGSDQPLVVTKQDALDLTLTVAPGHGAVGARNTVWVDVRDPAGAPVPGEVTVEAYHVEDDLTVARFRLPLDARGTAQVQTQFFDGAEHELRVEARSEGDVVTLSTPIDVVGVAPPLGTKLRTLGLLLVPVALGLTAGYRLGTRPPMKRSRGSAASSSSSESTQTSPLSAAERGDTRRTVPRQRRR